MTDSTIRSVLGAIVVLGFSGALQADPIATSRRADGSMYGEVKLLTYLPWLMDALDYIENEPSKADLCPLVDEIRAKMNEYFRLTLLARAACRDCQVDIILQRHTQGYGEVDGVPQDTFSSQARILELFEREHYDIIGAEGRADDPLTIESFIADEMDCGMTEEEVRAKILRRAPVDACNFYMLQHPEQPMIGVEQLPVLFLTGRVLLPMVKDGILPNNDLTAIFFSVRSELGLAKLIAELDELRLKRGALVMGFEHEMSLRRSAEWFGVKYRVINTASGK